MSFCFRVVAAVGLFLGLSASSRADDHLPHPVDILPQNAFAPPGFDDNDNVEVILQGNYISSCFRMGNPITQVDLVNHRIAIRSQTLFYRSDWCIQVLVPYVQPVSIGVLPAGVYDVEVMDTEGRLHSMARLPVAVAPTSAPDDFLYAPVTDAVLEANDILDLRGSFPDNCMSIQEVKVLYRAANIIEVMPIAVHAQRTCADVMVPFATQVKLNSPWRGTTLIHIRAMNGGAVNRVAVF